MYPGQPVQIVATDANITGMPMMTPYAGPLMNTPDNFIYVQDPFTEIAQCTGAIIRQQPSITEALTGCETQNRYHVFLQSPMGLKYAFKCSERSDTCARCCCSPERRPLQIIMRHVISLQELDSDLAKVFINVNKPCKCGCCCMCRPYMNVSLADNGQFLGKIREPYTCCDVETEIYDINRRLKYTMVGDCCQAGLCCCSPVQKLSSIRFDIRYNGLTVGSMRKLSASFGEFFTKADSYHILFPPSATPSDKILLILAGLMIDYQNFEGQKGHSESYAYY